MTSPEGEKYRGWWRVTSVDPPKSLEFTDGFADQDGTPIADMPTTTVQMQLTEHDGGTRMQLRSVFDSREQMQQLDSMGMTEGLRQAVGQMDALLAGGPGRRASRPGPRRPALFARATDASRLGQRVWATPTPLHRSDRKDTR
jgi:Activator of Hsp90 ATPase homolog 1-like protein